MEPDRGTGPSRHTRWLVRLVLGAAIALLALVVACFVILAVAAQPVAKYVADRTLPGLSQQLGQELTFGEIHARIFPLLHVDLEHVKVRPFSAGSSAGSSPSKPSRGGSGEPGELDFVDIERLSVGVKTLPLALSLGKRVEIGQLLIERPQLNLIRGADGHWNYESVQRGSSSEGESSNRTIRLGDIEVRNGRIALYERGGSAGGGKGQPPRRAHPVGGGPGSNGAAAADRNATVALDALDVSMRDVVVGGSGAVDSSAPIHIKARLASNKQNVTFDGTLGALGTTLGSSDSPERASPTRMRGDLSVSEARLADFASAMPAQLSKIASGGLFSFRGTLESEPDGTSRLSGDGKVEGLSAGPSRYNATFGVSTRVEGGAKNNGFTLDIPRFHLRGPGTDLQGHASAHPGGGQSFGNVRFAISGTELDSAPFLREKASDGAADSARPSVRQSSPSRSEPSQSSQPEASQSSQPEASQSSQPEPSQSSQPEPSQSSQALPADTAERLSGMKVQGTIDIASVRAGRFDLQNLKASGSFARGVATLSEAKADLYGGSISLDGTEIDFRVNPPKWELHGSAQGFDAGRLGREWFEAPLLQGKASSQAQLSGAGTDWDHLRDSISGTCSISMADGAVAYDLGDRIARPLADALGKVGLGATARPFASGGSTKVLDLNAAFAVHDGWASLRSPLHLDTSIGKLTLNGRVRLDGKIELTGQADLNAPFLASVSSALPASLALPVTLRGSLTNPEVGVSLRPEDLARQGLQKLIPHGGGLPDFLRGLPNLP